jgi:hypothetical protein
MGGLSSLRSIVQNEQERWQLLQTAALSGIHGQPTSAAGDAKQFSLKIT